MHVNNPSVTLESTLFLIPINILATNLFMALGGWLDKNMNQRVLILVGTALIGGGNMICSASNTLIMIIIGDFILGIATGIMYMTPIKNCWQYFPDKKGMVSGIIVCGFGLSSFIFSFIAKAIVNPTNEPLEKDGYYGPDVYDNVTKLFIILGSIYTGLGILSATLFVPFRKEANLEELHPQDNTQEMNTNSLLKKDEEKTVETQKTQSNETICNAFLSIPFLYILIMPLLTSSYGFFTVNAIKIFGKEFHIDDSTLTLASSLAGFGNGASRIVWGMLLDKWKFKKTYYFVCFSQIVLSSTIYFTPSINEYVYVLYCLLSLCTEGSHFAIFPLVTRHVFGAKNSIEIYGLVYIAFTGGAFIGPILTNYLVKGNDKIYYLVLFLTFTVFNVISIILCWTFKYEEFKYSNDHVNASKEIDENNLEYNKHNIISEEEGNSPNHHSNTEPAKIN